MRIGTPAQSKHHPLRAACIRIAVSAEMSVKVGESQANERRQLRRNPYLASGLRMHAGQLACPEVADALGYPCAPMPLNG